MANRLMRDNFPHDWLIACHLDTGTVSALTLQFMEIINGNFSLVDWGNYDPRLVPAEIAAPLLVKFKQSMYLVDEKNGEINDGRWLIEIDGFKSIRYVYRLPGH